MRFTTIRVRSALMIALLIAVPCVATALERTAARVSEDAVEDWIAGASCPVSYYNNCHGWGWSWGSGGNTSPRYHWQDKDVFGIIYDPCCANATLNETSTYIFDGFLPGWGYTGTIEISSASANGCPDVLLAQQAFLPTSGSTVHSWDLPTPERVVLTFTVSDPGILLTFLCLATDTPNLDSGICYPSDRETHSFYYGNEGQNCPGWPLYQGVGNAEWLYWVASFSCPTSVDDGAPFRSWGGIKSLYR
ncbi:MAG: hypothetical protein DHS20C21_05000 [Gemmatimonadota bacterium]|nr:MAG: hypothetical protein DHS20C21_05000 [Gemmatimonadota bacterium]